MNGRNLFSEIFSSLDECSIEPYFGLKNVHNISLSNNFYLISIVEFENFLHFNYTIRIFLRESKIEILNIKTCFGYEIILKINFLVFGNQILKCTIFKIKKKYL